MNFSPNKTPIEIIKEGAFGGTYFRDVYSNINKKWYKNSWKEFVHLKNIDAKFYASDYYDVNVNKYGVKYGTRGGYRFSKRRCTSNSGRKTAGRFKGRCKSSKLGLGKSPRSPCYSGFYQYKNSQYLCHNSLRPCCVT